MEGITSLSIKPMRMITGVGMAVVGISILMLAYSVIPVSYTHLICQIQGGGKKKGGFPGGSKNKRAGACKAGEGKNISF